MIDIIIVNWNSGSQLRECVESVIANNVGEVVEIVVVDNGSTDGSADAAAELPGVTLVRAGENLGFGAACNVGAERGNSPYILFLNPDSQVNEDSISAPLAYMEHPKNADVGVCGVQLVDEQGEVSRTCARFPTLGRLVAAAIGLDKLSLCRGAGVHMNDWDHSRVSHVDHLIGAFYLMRRQVFEDCGGFDSRFFVYLEDVDLSARVRAGGWKSVYLATAQAFHAGGGTSRQIKARRLFYSLRSRLLYGFKHFPRWQAWLLVAVTCLVEPLTRMIYCLLRRDWKGVLNTWGAYRMLVGNLGCIIRGEGRVNP